MVPSSPPENSYTPAPNIFFTLGEVLQGDDAQFVGNAYWAMLGRPVDETGLKIYTALLADGKSRVEVLIELRRSSEGKAHGFIIDGLVGAKSLAELLAHQDHAFVSCAYQTLLLRPVDTGALTRYAMELSHGMDRLQVLNEIRSSVEFKSRDAIGRYIDHVAKHGQSGESSVIPASDAATDEIDDVPELPSSSNELMSRNDAHFIRGLYQIMLGREVDRSGFDNYLGLLKSGVSRHEVMRAISHSGEREARRAMFRQLDSATSDFQRQHHRFLGWAATRRNQTLDQSITRFKFQALERQFMALNQSLRGQLASAKNRHAQQAVNSVVVQAPKKRALKLTQLPPLARDIYFQLKTGLDERKDGGA